MAVIRVPKVNNFTIMSNFHLRDKNLSFKAVGLMSWMLSNPDDWDYTIAGIVKARKEGKDAITAMVKELEEYGYLERILVRKKNGSFDGYEYVLYEEPKAENPMTENPMTENPQQISTIRNNNYIKQVSKKVSKGERKSFNEIINSNFENEELRKLLGEFIQLRVHKKKTPTNTTLQYLLDKLKKLSSNDETKSIEIVKQSLIKTYTDFYELKDKKTKPAEKKKVKTNQFNNFHQREYTKEELDEWEIKMLTSK